MLSISIWKRVEGTSSHSWRKPPRQSRCFLEDPSGWLAVGGKRGLPASLVVPGEEWERSRQWQAAEPQWKGDKASAGEAWTTSSRKRWRELRYSAESRGDGSGAGAPAGALSLRRMKHAGLSEDRQPYTHYLVTWSQASKPTIRPFHILFWTLPRAVLWLEKGRRRPEFTFLEHKC